MAEGQVSIDGVTHLLPDPFIVLATDNPIEYEGTYPLPEAQLDRFTIRLELRYLSDSEEVSMLQRRIDRGSPEQLVDQVVDADDLLAMREAVEQVTVHSDVLRYVVSLAAATRQHPQVAVGASPRAELDLVQLARARALLDGRDYVIPEDVKALARPGHGAPDQPASRDVGQAGAQRRRRRRTPAPRPGAAHPRCDRDRATVDATSNSIGGLRDSRGPWPPVRPWRLPSRCWPRNGKSIAFAAPLLGLLASLRWQPAPPTVHVHAQPGLFAASRPSEVRFAVWASRDDGAAVGLELSTVGRPAAGGGQRSARRASRSAHRHSAGGAIRSACG